jgi:hypothetical protein
MTLSSFVQMGQHLGLRRLHAAGTSSAVRRNGAKSSGVSVSFSSSSFAPGGHDIADVEFMLIAHRSTLEPDFAGLDLKTATAIGILP